MKRKIVEITEEQKVKRFMRLRADEHTDPLTGEINTTGLAEYAILVLAVNGDEGADVWDWAVEVVDQLERFRAS